MKYVVKGTMKSMLVEFKKDVTPNSLGMQNLAEIHIETTLVRKPAVVKPLKIWQLSWKKEEERESSSLIGRVIHSKTTSSTGNK